MEKIVGKVYHFSKTTYINLLTAKKELSICGTPSKSNKVPPSNVL